MALIAFQLKIWSTSTLHDRILESKAINRLTKGYIALSMFAYTIQPGRGLEGLAFHASRPEVRSYFVADVSSATELSGLPTDLWPDLGVQAYYSKKERLTALQLTRPSCFSLMGTSMQDLSFAEALHYLRSLDSNVLISPDAAHSSALGLTVCQTDDQFDSLITLVLDSHDYED